MVRASSQAARLRRLESDLLLADAGSWRAFAAGAQPFECAEAAVGKRRRFDQAQGCGQQAMSP
jgi:hypothetical protein